MTAEQAATVERITKSGFDEVHHGDCVGADTDMHRIARANGQRVVGHPPTNPRLRAWNECDDLLPEADYHVRNRAIVDACDVLVATPAEYDEQPRGGTWGTVRYARSVGREHVVVLPDGTLADGG